MSEKWIQVNIVTPNGVVYSHRGKSISVQSTEGRLTILPNHIPIVTALAIGEVIIERVTEGMGTNYIAIDSGLLEFQNNICNLITNSAERARDIDWARAEETRMWAEGELKEAQLQHDPLRMKRAQIVLNKAINRMGVSKRIR